jgi:hypothetical protein
VRQGVGLARLVAEVFGTVLQAGQAGFQAGVLAEHGHFQARLHATAVGVHLRDQRVGGGLFGQAQQALEAALLPAQAQQAQGTKARRPGQSPRMASQLPIRKLTWLIRMNGSQSCSTGSHLSRRVRRLALIDALVQRLGAADLLGGGLDPHRLEATTWLLSV